MKFQLYNTTCTNCTNKIVNKLKENNYDITLIGTDVAVVKNATLSTSDNIIKIIRDLGYDAKLLNDEKISVNINGMSCANCALKVEKSVEDFVIQSDVSITLNKGFFILENKEDKELLLKTINDLGYEATIEGDQVERKNIFNNVKLIIGIVGTIYFILQMILVHFMNLNINFLSNKYFDLLIATIVQFTVGLQYYKDAYSDFKQRSFGMNFLVACSTNIAYFYSIALMFTNTHTLFFEIQVILLSIIYLGNFVEDKIKQKSNKSLKALLNFHVKNALVLENDNTIEKPIEFVSKGDIVVVLPGNQIPLDGVIISGNTSIDESVLTGEELLVDKKENDKVFAGTLNNSGSITIQVEKKYDETYISSVINQVSEISNSKPKIQEIGDVIVSKFVIIILIITVLTFLFWLIITGDLYQALYCAIATLVIACPCALGLATPLTFLIGSSKLYQNQLLVKDIGKIVNINNIDIIAFDKTGTITNKIVNNVEGNLTKSLASQIISIEKNSNHPIAKSIVSYLNDLGYESNSNRDIEVLKGYGATDGELYIGSKKIVDKLNVKNNLENNDNVYVIKDGKIILNFEFKMDIIKDNINNIKLLKNKYELFLITGDNEREANLINDVITFDQVHSSVLADQKADIIKTIKKENKSVIYIGDGINDTLALSLADISIAINNEVDVVKEISDVILIESDFSKINSLITIAKKMKKNIYQNYFWAFSYNVIAIPLAVTGNLNPLIAGIMMSVSSIVVLLNSSRLNFIKI